MDKMQFENGTLVSPAKVVIDGVEHEVTPAVYKGNTPFSAENINQMQDNIERAIAVGGVAGDTLPIGSVVEFASDTSVPENWLLCNGQAVSRTEYDLLFAVIGTTWGAGDGSTTFNVPTKEGLVTVGKKSSDTDFNTLGKTGGEKEVTLTIDEMPSHQHKMSLNNYGSDYCSAVEWSSSEEGGQYKYSGDMIEPAGGDQPHNNLQPYVTSNFIIKARQSSGVVADVVDSLDSDSTKDALSAKQGKVLNSTKSNKGTVLFESSGDNSTTITLNDDISNYDRYRIYFALGLNGPEVSNEVYVGEACALSGAYSGHFELAEGAYYGIRLNATSARIDGNILTKSIGYCFTFKTDNTMKFADTENEIHITKVVGYKD